MIRPLFFQQLLRQQIAKLQLKESSICDVFDLNTNFDTGGSISATKEKHNSYGRSQSNLSNRENRESTSCPEDCEQLLSQFEKTRNQARIFSH